MERIEMLIVENERLREALKDACDELECEIRSNYPEPIHPALTRRLSRDLSSVDDYRLALLQQPDAPTEKKP